jgi:cyanophycinase-like exopeptidase
MRVRPIRCCLCLLLASSACADGGAPGGPLPTPLTVFDESAPAPDRTPHVVFFPRIGSIEDDDWGAIGPGVVLMNGGLKPTTAFGWMKNTVDSARIAGDVVVLSTSGGDVYSEPIYAAAAFNSVQTVLVPPGAPDSDIVLVANRLQTAEIVFLADSDSASFGVWARTSLGPAVQGVYGRGGVVAGAGTGAMALGSTVLSTGTDSYTALANPYAPTITLERGVFGLPAMDGTYVDINLQTADRFGVLAAMTARTLVQGTSGTPLAAALGLGVDVNAALAIDHHGNVTLLGDDGAQGMAWMVGGSAVDQVTEGEPLVWKTARVTRFDAVGESWSIPSNCGTAFGYDVAIDGSEATPYSPANPYDAQGTASPCEY